MFEDATTHVQVACSVEEETQVGSARRAASQLAQRVGLDTTTVGAVALVATELGTNLLRHAGRGELLIRTMGAAPEVGIEIISVDRGPGMADVERCLIDGYSTASGPGTGLGAVRRQSSEFDVVSKPGKGTVVVARLRANEKGVARESHPLELGFVRLPYPGETACGDAWVVHHGRDRAVIMVADGLGHGPAAAEASSLAVRTLRDYVHETPAGILERCHDAMKNTRGAAMLVARVSYGTAEVLYAGIGNIAGELVGVAGVRESLVSHSGIVGHGSIRIREHTCIWGERAMLVMHSDGLGSHWRSDDYGSWPRQHPSAIAAGLYRDYRRERDDVTVLVGAWPDRSSKG